MTILSPRATIAAIVLRTRCSRADAVRAVAIVGDDVDRAVEWLRFHGRCA